MSLFGELPQVLTVTELVQSVRRAIRDAVPVPVTIRGEIANFTRQPSGHLYFTLRDEGAALRCAMFRGANRFLRFQPTNGMQIEARGEVGVYVPRGDLQLVVEAMQPAGLGAQMAALEALKARLAAEGLLAPERKRPLPLLPRRVGLVTSPRGAAVRDLLEILGRRAPGVEVIVSPTVVQGAGAEHAIAAAFERLAGAGLVEVIIIARGGGSLEDLWAFNAEPVARAIAASPVPVVAGIGHEVDVTLADLVADVRAATPSHAAELVVPRVAELAEQLGARSRRLLGLLAGRLAEERRRLQGFAGSYVLRRPSRLLEDDTQRLDELWNALLRGLRRRLALAAGELAARPARLALSLRHRQQGAARDWTERGARLVRAAAGIAPPRRARLDGLAGRLRALGPASVLGRGYVLARRATSGELVTSARSLRPQATLRLDFVDGYALTAVTQVRPSAVPLTPAKGDEG